MAARLEGEQRSARLGLAQGSCACGSARVSKEARLGLQCRRRGAACGADRRGSWRGMGARGLGLRLGAGVRERGAGSVSGERARVGFGRAGVDRFRVRASAETWVRLRRLEARAADRLRVAAAGDGCARIEAAPFGFDRSGAAGWLRLSRRVPAALRRIYAARRGWLRIRRSAARMRSGSGFGLQTRCG